MKVFVSSLIAGFGTYRSAVRSAVATLRHEPIMAEDFGASPNTPQIACLSGLREADLVVLVLGDSYGSVQSGSGLSATHEEYREARGSKPVIAFVQEGRDPDSRQAAFISEVESWEGGLFRGGFSDAGGLQAGVTRALHDYELANAIAPIDPAALVARARALLPDSNRNGGFQETPKLGLAIVGGPLQRVLRPVQIEASDLSEGLHQAALFGQARIFDGSKGVQAGVRDASLYVEQERGAQLRLDEDGSIFLRLPLDQHDRSNPSSTRGHSAFSALIEEVVHQTIATGLVFAGLVLERIDPTQRLTHLAIAARIDGGDHYGWRTQAEHEASPNSGSMRMGYGDAGEAIIVSQSRAALRLNTVPIVEDLVVPLRRQWKSR